MFTCLKLFEAIFVIDCVLVYLNKECNLCKKVERERGFFNPNSF